MASVDEWLTRIEDNTRQTRDIQLALARGMMPGQDELAGNVSAFSRPQPVLVMGPRPLPVTGDGSGGGNQPPKREPEDPSWVRRLADRLENALSSAISRGLSQANALTARGMRGTLEQAQLEYAQDQLGRQFAAVMLPVTQAMTYAANQIERQMRGWGGAEQNRLMGTILGGGIGYQLGGWRGAMLGGIMGPGVIGQAQGQDMLAASLAGGYMGWRAGGPWGAVAGAIAAPATIAPADYSSERPSDYWSRMRRPVAEGGGGMNWLESMLATGGRAVGHTLGLSESRPGAAPVPKPSEARRDVTPFMPQQVNAGETAMRIQEGMIRATAGEGFEEAGPFKPIIDLMMQGVQLLAKIAGVPFDPSPTPAGKSG